VLYHRQGNLPQRDRQYMAAKTDICYTIDNLNFYVVMRSIEQLMKEALSLSSASRSLLAEKLVESREFEVDETVQNLGTTEAKKRRDEVRCGWVQPIPGDEALAQIRRML
jgi:hypothetical protein